ncbi:MAG: hypothetical protein LAT64_00620 [Phycisphaerales bacterium]|nr:hypothetical protein [Planctomycetota bacterium]MCH8507265.1 hypothetical protein [Phycisphaerales bacterium]
MNAARHEDARTGLGATFRPLVDDRGRPIRRIQRADLLRAARSDNPGLAMLANRLRAAIRSESRRNTPDRIALVVVLVLGVMFLFFTTSAFLSMYLHPRGAGVSLLVLVLLIWGSRRLYSGYVRRGALGQIAWTAVAEGVCGSCAFSLEGAPPDADGHTVCPECGAAWRQERIVSPYWSKPAVVILRPSILPWVLPGVRRANELFTPDDRGRFVQSPDSRMRTVRRELLSAVSPEEQRTIIRAMRRCGCWWRALLTLVLLVMPAYFFYLAWLAHRHNDVIGFWILLALASVILLSIASVPMTSAFCGPHRTARVLVRHGRCGSCLTPLDGAPADDQGRRVCEHCGAAWLTPDPPPPAT